MDQCRYIKCNDEVLRSIANAVAKKLPPTTNFTADLEATHHFPLHIATAVIETSTTVANRKHLENNEVPQERITHNSITEGRWCICGQ